MAENANPGPSEVTEEGSDSSEEDVYEVEKIVGQKKVNGEVLYKVRWVGYGPQWDTFEPPENLGECDDLIEAFQKQEEQKREKRGRKSQRWMYLSSDEESGQGGAKSLLKDRFWDDLEHGKVNVMQGDLYSKIKTGRAAKPRSLREKTTYETHSQERSSKPTTSSSSDTRSDTRAAKKRSPKGKKVGPQKRRGRPRKATSHKDIAKSDDITQSACKTSKEILPTAEKSTEVTVTSAMETDPKNEEIIKNLNESGSIDSKSEELNPEFYENYSSDTDVIVDETVDLDTWVPPENMDMDLGAEESTTIETNMSKTNSNILESMNHSEPSSEEPIEMSTDNVAMVLQEPVATVPKNTVSAKESGVRSAWDLLTASTSTMNSSSESMNSPCTTPTISKANLSFSPSKIRRITNLAAKVMAKKVEIDNIENKAKLSHAGMVDTNEKEILTASTAVEVVMESKDDEGKLVHEPTRTSSSLARDLSSGVSVSSASLSETESAARGRPLEDGASVPGKALSEVEKQTVDVRVKQKTQNIVEATDQLVVEMESNTANENIESEEHSEELMPQEIEQEPKFVDNMTEPETEFTESPEKVRSAVLRKMGPKSKTMANTPRSPSADSNASASSEASIKSSRTGMSSSNNSTASTDSKDARKSRHKQVKIDKLRKKKERCKDGQVRKRIIRRKIRKFKLPSGVTTPEDFDRKRTAIVLLDKLDASKYSAVAKLKATLKKQRTTQKGYIPVIASCPDDSTGLQRSKRIVTGLEEEGQRAGPSLSDTLTSENTETFSDTLTSEHSENSVKVKIDDTVECADVKKVTSLTSAEKSDVERISSVNETELKSKTKIIETPSSSKSRDIVATEKMGKVQYSTKPVEELEKEAVEIDRKLEKKEQRSSKNGGVKHGKEKLIHVKHRNEENMERIVLVVKKDTTKSQEHEATGKEKGLYVIEKGSKSTANEHDKKKRKKMKNEKKQKEMVPNETDTKKTVPETERKVRENIVIKPVVDSVEKPSLATNAGKGSLAAEMTTKTKVESSKRPVDKTFSTAIMARGPEKSRDQAKKRMREPPRPSRVIQIEMEYPKFKKQISDEIKKQTTEESVEEKSEPLPLSSNSTSTVQTAPQKILVANEVAMGLIATEEKIATKDMDLVEEVDMDICDKSDVDICLLDDKNFFALMDREVEHMTEEDLEKLDREIEQAKKTILTPVELKTAVKCGDFKKLNLVLSNSEPGIYNLEICDHTGMTLLMLAAFSGHDEICELLVRHGANVNAAQKNGSTALIHAAEKGQVHVVTKLLQLGAHLNIQNAVGESALIRAVRKGQKPVVEALLKWGPNTSQTNNADVSAIRLSQLMKNVGIRTLLDNFNARLLGVFVDEVVACTGESVLLREPLFPIQCFSLCEGRQFTLHFNHELLPCEEGFGTILCIAQALFAPEGVRCRLYGACAVRQVVLNNVAQVPLTQGGMFVMTLSPLHNGKNELDIRTDNAPKSKAKLIICAYRVELL